MQARQPLLGICTLVAIVGAPLFLRLVPINAVYGLRTVHTLASKQAWYDVNAFLGWALIFAAVSSAGLLLFAPGAARLWLSTVYFAVPMASALCASLTYATRVS